MTTASFLIEGQWQSARCCHAESIQSFVSCVGEADLPHMQPAPIDLHVHGAGGHDVMEGDASLRQVLKAQARLGCGALLATSVAAPVEAIDEFIASVQRVMSRPDAGSAQLLGAHLEGPFINPDKLGAQPPYASSVDGDVLERWLSTGVVRVVTYAPEMDADACVPALCKRYGVRAQIGHSLCDCWQARTAIAAGCGITHLWNAMSGASHRGGGVAVAALAEAEYAEIIADGIHVDELAFAAARRSIPRLYVVTDGTAAVGMADGPYRLGSHWVTRRGHRVELADGTLAGSCLDQIRLCSVLRGWGLSWREIAHMNSTLPAAWIGEPQLGSIRVGARAQWLEHDGESVRALWLHGERQEISYG